MEDTQFIVQALFFIVNCFAIAFICTVVTRWIQRVEELISVANKSIDASAKRLDSVYVNQLLLLQQMYAATEQYEEAAKVKRLVEIELKLQKERLNEKSVQDRNQG
ncbi:MULTISPECIES: hypothetical protein [Butyricimonas]|uniref:hypothetical protein n=1 Tax=Butyricimonas TaxID=574697 RepID=UPI0007FB25F8|nr:MULTISPECIES: hypothetical protein [Butyricimonas]